MFTFFGEACFSDVIFIINFKINSCYIIKYNTYILIKYFTSMFKTDLLNNFLLSVI
jgi:hypothetical protein